MEYKTRQKFGAGYIHHLDGDPTNNEPENLAMVLELPDSVAEGDIVQITDEGHHWFGTLVIVTELKSFGVQGYAPMPTNDGSGTGEAYIRLSRSQYEKVGKAALVSA